MSNNKEEEMSTESKEVKKEGGTNKTVDKVEKVTPSSSKEVIVSKPKRETEVAVLTESELATLDYADFSTPARMLELGKVLAKSQLVPLKKPEDVVVALMTGKELGLGFVTAISQIYPINGRPTLGVHLQKALCLKHGVVIEKLEEAVAIYEFVEADDNGKPILVDAVIKGQSTKIPNVIGKGTLQEQPPKTLKREIDKRTTYKLTREIKMPSGKFKEITATGSFSLSEAREAELLEKDVWIKYWRRMLDARAFTNVVGEIADDITLGLRAPNELSNNFYINSNNEEVHYTTVEEQ